MSDITAIEACASCGKAWSIDMVDYKPPLLRRRSGLLGWCLRRLQVWLLWCAASEGEDFTYGEGPCCYGPGWSPGP